MAEGVKETASEKSVLKVIKGGASPLEIIEVKAIGDYKLYHPSTKRQRINPPDNITPLRKK